MATTHPSLRRNLFHQTLSRRPATTGPPNGPSTSTNASANPGANANMNSNSNTNMPPPNNTVHSTRPSHRAKPAHTEPPRSAKLPDNREIVVRDKNGCYKLDIPVLPPALIGENGEELGDLDAEETGESTLDAELSGRDKEKFEAALVEMIIRHRNRPSSGEPDEILNIVNQSLRKTVASLDDDNWMFEPERDVRI